MYKLTAFVAAIVLSSAFLVAQAPQAPTHAPDGGSRQMITSIVVPPLPNAPFSATVNTEWTRYLSDGATLVLKSRRLIARDGLGRVFEERRFLVPQLDAARQPRLTQTEVKDPTTHTAAFCNPYDHVCELHVYRMPAVPPVLQPGTAPDRSRNLTRTELGTQTVNGIELLGTREEMRVSGAMLGSDRPIAITKEFWYSRQLGLNVVTKRDDPRSGVEQFTVSDITQGEPDASLFALPPDVRIIDRRPGAQGR